MTGQDDCCLSYKIRQTKVPLSRPRESFVLTGPLMNHFPLTPLPVRGASVVRRKSNCAVAKKSKN